MATPMDTVRPYYTMEAVMERKALALGGTSMRRAFFQYLQRMRDKSRYEHGPCSASFRAWMADKLTWEHFFPRERFEGIEPVGRDIHRCKDLKSREPSGKGSYSNRSYIVVRGAYQHKFECSDSQLQNLTHIILIDNELWLVEKAMQCQLHVQAQADIWSLIIAIDPFLEGLHPAILKMATDMLLDWIKQALKKPFKLSTFWENWSRQNLTSYGGIAIENSHPPPMSAITKCKPTAGEIQVSGSAGIVEVEWQKYADAFGCSNVDRVVIEGQVLAEASLRLVLDGPTGDVVTLEEFESRVRGREQTKVKRKAEFADGFGYSMGNLEKKLCL